MSKGNDILRLHPHDFFVTAGGLRIENTTDDMVMEVHMPESITVYPLEIGRKNDSEVEIL